MGRICNRFRLAILPLRFSTCQMPFVLRCWGASDCTPTSILSDHLNEFGIMEILILSRPSTFQSTGHHTFEDIALEDEEDDHHRNDINHVGCHADSRQGDALRVLESRRHFHAK